MKHFSQDYYIYNNELYKKIHPTKKGYRITNKNKQRKWITMKQILDFIHH